MADIIRIETLTDFESDPAGNRGERIRAAFLEYVQEHGQKGKSIDTLAQDFAQFERLRYESRPNDDDDVPCVRFIACGGMMRYTIIAA